MDIDPSLLHRHTAVSADVTEQMILGAMRRTTDADLGAAITGHLGPDAPEELDGIVYVSIALRKQDELTLETNRHRLTTSSRGERQREATEFVLQEVSRRFKNPDS